MKYPKLIFVVLLAISSLPTAFAADNAGTQSEIFTGIPESGQINATQIILSNATIDTNVSSLLFVLTWLNTTSNLEATLINPAGEKIDSTIQPPVIYGANTSLIFYILPNAEMGKWTAVIKAKDVPDMGESYWTLFSTISGGEYSNQDMDYEESINPE
jgi:hypothetical protein